MKGLAREMQEQFDLEERGEWGKREEEEGKKEGEEVVGKKEGEEGGEKKEEEEEGEKKEEKELTEDERMAREMQEKFDAEFAASLGGGRRGEEERGRGGRRRYGEVC